MRITTLSENNIKYDIGLMHELLGNLDEAEKLQKSSFKKAKKDG